VLYCHFALFQARKIVKKPQKIVFCEKTQHFNPEQEAEDSRIRRLRDRYAGLRPPRPVAPLCIQAQTSQSNCR
jgi:hypothetical protein